MAIVLSVLLDGCGSTNALNGKKTNVFIPMFEARTGVTINESQRITGEFKGLLGSSGKFILVDRTPAEAPSKNNRTESSTSEGQNNLLEPKIRPATKLLFGSIGRLDTLVYSITIKMVDVETSKVDIALSKVFHGELSNVPNEFFEEYVYEIVKVAEKGKDNR